MKKIGIFFLFSFLILSALPVKAALLNTASKSQIEYNKNIEALASSTEYSGKATVEDTISTVIKIAMTFLGTIFIGLTILTGINWMRAEGNQEEVKKAKRTILNLVIGLVLVIAAYALSSGISNALIKNLIG